MKADQKTTASGSLLEAVQALVHAHNTAETAEIERAETALWAKCASASVEDFLSLKSHMAPWDLSPADQVEVFRLAYGRSFNDALVTLEYAAMLHHYYGEEDDAAAEVRRLRAEALDRHTLSAKVMPIHTYGARGSVHWMTCGANDVDETFDRNARLQEEEDGLLLRQLDEFIRTHCPTYGTGDPDLDFGSVEDFLKLSVRDLLFAYRAMIWCRDVDKLGDYMMTYTGAEEHEIEEAITRFGTALKKYTARMSCLSRSCRSRPP